MAISRADGSKFTPAPPKRQFAAKPPSKVEEKTRDFLAKQEARAAQGYAQQFVELEPGRTPIRI